MAGSRQALNVLVLNGSLKHDGTPSNTEEVVELVLSHMREADTVETDVLRLSDLTLPPGVGMNEGAGDAWPEIYEKIKATDILVIATPIWWGGRSSLTQRIIERMDTFDEEAHAGRDVLRNKVAGIVITGSEDGAQATMAGIMEVLSFMNFTLPPQCCTYWVGEVGMDPKTDPQRRGANKSVDTMAKQTAGNLVAMARILKDNPLPEIT